MKTKGIFLWMAGLVFLMLSCDRDSDDLEGGGKGTYHNEDKEGLRIFLQQPSAETGKINAEWLGLQTSDISDWKKNEAWVGKVAGLTWNNEAPKRLVEIDWSLQIISERPFDPPLSGSLDASKWAVLKKLKCSGNPINALDLSKNTALESLDCAGNQLTSLDLRNNTKLKELICGGNQLTSLDLHNNVELKELHCAGNQLSPLDLHNNTGLEVLDCSNNQNMTSLDLSSNTALTHLICTINPISTLDLSSNTLLKHLDCGSDQLTSINVRANKALTYFIVVGQLTELDLSMNTELEAFRCRGNRLTELDLSNNTKLQSFNCAVNKLTDLTLNSNLLNNVNCEFNRLPLYTILKISEMITLPGLFFLGPQFLPPQTVSVGSEIEFPDQNVFKGINTQFTVHIDAFCNNETGEFSYGVPAPQSDYTLLSDGKIKFNNTGTFWVVMTNETFINSNDEPDKVFAEIIVK